VTKTVARISAGVVSAQPRQDVASEAGTAVPIGGIKRILACIDGTESDHTVLDHAQHLALRFAAHVDVLHVHFDAGAASGGRNERHIDRLLGGAVERAAIDSANRARRHFEDWQMACGLPLRDIGTNTMEPSVRWREITGYEADVVARLGRLSDLIVLPRPGEHSSSFALLALETALFDTCRPVLLAPFGTTPSLFDRALIAWNGSLEAARAVGFALPFLIASTNGVAEFSAPESKHRTDTAELLDYLRWHGILVDRLPVENLRPTGESLLEQADATRAGLLVMGAYTHGHFRQFLFGGVTRYVMQHAAVPVLLAH
jgi:nucleotide-binding universal stress UspA family protein